MPLLATQHFLFLFLFLSLLPRRTVAAETLSSSEGSRSSKQEQEKATAMEVQAQYPSSPAPFTPNCSSRKVASVAGGAAAPFLHNKDAVAQLGSLPATFLPLQQTFVDGAAMFSGEPESELTCNASGSRKRAFLDGGVAHPVLHNDLQQQQKKTRLAHAPREVASLVKAAPASGAWVGAPSSLQGSHDEIRLNDSVMASTSGRSPAEAPLPPEAAPAISPFMEDFVSQLFRQNIEVEAFVRLQNESIRSGLEDARKRHHRALLSVMEQGVMRRLREREAELESANRRNTEIEDKVRQLAAENQIWFNVARNNEAIVSSLRATLDQAVLHNATAVVGRAAYPAGGTTAIRSAQSQEQREGFGESDCAVPILPAEDAQSCCHEGPWAAAAEAVRDTAATTDNPRDVRLPSACKACLEREASVLLLPCRHVCLCMQCDSSVGACPLCNAPKNASLQVFMC